MLIPTPDSAIFMENEDDCASASSEAYADDLLEFDAHKPNSHLDLYVRGVEAEAEVEMARNSSVGKGATDPAPVCGFAVPGTVQKYWHSPMLSWQKGLAVNEESTGSDERDSAIEDQAGVPALPVPMRHSKRVGPFPVVSELKVDTAAAAKVRPTAAKSRAASLTAAFEVEVLGPLKGGDKPQMTGIGTRTRSRK